MRPKKPPRDSSFVGKENSQEDLILCGLLADGAVWSSQGLHIVESPNEINFKKKLNEFR